MSNAPPAAKPLPPPEHPNDPHLSALAAALLEAGQALLAAGAALPAAAPDAGPGGEVRSYHFTPAVLEHEKELLRRYRTDNFLGLLTEAHNLLLGLVKVMQSVHGDVRVKGYVIKSLGCLLDQATALLLRMKNVYGRVIPLEK